MAECVTISKSLHFNSAVTVILLTTSGLLACTHVLNSPDIQHLVFHSQKANFVFPHKKNKLCANPNYDCFFSAIYPPRDACWLN